MTTQKSYIYNILQYKHSEFSGEAVNIGIILYWPKTNSIIFRYSKNLHRIKNLYKNFSEKIIIEYLKIIENKCNSINNSKITLFSIQDTFHYDEFLETQFLFNNNNSLQFSKSISAINYFDNFDDVLNNLVQRYFISNEVNKEVKTHRETSILKKFNDTLEELGISTIEDIENKYIKNKIVTNETGNKIKFDIAWKNGSLNLIKPINFDLNDQKYIADKAYKNYGLFTDLENEAIENNYRYDLMLIRPQNSTFFKDYDHALKLLSNLNKVQLVEEDGFTKYTQYAYNELIKKPIK
jgi:hypothetical protein